MARERSKPLPGSDPPAEPQPDDERRRREHDEILRLQREVEDEITNMLYALACDRDRWC